MITIVLVRNSECQKIRTLEQRVWRDRDVSGPYDIAFFVRYGYAFAAKERGKIVGAIVAMKTKDDEVKVVDWVVDEEYRGRGIGRRLYERLEKAVSGMPIIALVKGTNRLSIGAHKRLGFRKAGTIKDPFSLGAKNPWWVMKKR